MIEQPNQNDEEEIRTTSHNSPFRCIYTFSNRKDSTLRVIMVAKSKSSPSRLRSSARYSQKKRDGTIEINTTNKSLNATGTRITQEALPSQALPNTNTNHNVALRINSQSQHQHCIPRIICEEFQLRDSCCCCGCSGFRFSGLGRLLLGVRYRFWIWV